MKKLFLYPTASLIGILVLLKIILASSFVTDRINTAIRQKAEEQQLSLSIEKISLGLTEITFEKVTGLVRKLLLPFTLDSLEIRPVLSSLIFSEKQADISARLYQGTIEATVIKTTSGQKIPTLSGDRITLGLHPALSALGFSGCLLSFSLSNLEVQASGPVAGAGQIKLIQCLRPNGGTIPLPFGGGRIPLPVPRFEIQNLVSQITFRPGEILLPDFRLDSSLAQCHGEARLPARGKKKFIIQCTISADGASLLRPFSSLINLPLISEGSQLQCVGDGQGLPNCTMLN